MGEEAQENGARNVAPADPNDAAGEKNQPRQRRYLSVVNSIINAAGVVVVVWGVWVAKDTLVSINKNVDIAGAAVETQIKQLQLAVDQFTAARDALWLDQRPWLAFSKAETVPNEIEQGGGATFRFHILNSGKTPAFNVRLLRSDVEVQPNTYVFSEPSKWIPTPLASTRSIYTDSRETTAVFPNSTVYYDVSIPPIHPLRYEPYTKKHFYLAVAARLEYCDANRSLHWTQLGVAKVSSETELIVQHNTASLHPGEPDHPDCRDDASARGAVNGAHGNGCSRSARPSVE